MTVKRTILSNKSDNDISIINFNYCMENKEHYYHSRQEPEKEWCGYNGL